MESKTKRRRLEFCRYLVEMQLGESRILRIAAYLFVRFLVPSRSLCLKQQVADIFW